MSGGYKSNVWVIAVFLICFPLKTVQYNSRDSLTRVTAFLKDFEKCSRVSRKAPTKIREKKTYPFTSEWIPTHYKKLEVSNYHSLKLPRKLGISYHTLNIKPLNNCC